MKTNITFLLFTFGFCLSLFGNDNDVATCSDGIQNGTETVSIVEEIANLVQIFLCFQVTLQATSH
ncbi:MAG: hypothetical protein CM15mP59_6340 [Flavobacteriaceae bacterium]|nr:MAG: hypothetical protein CM15mP59_6340 [Flavobacteriaceae bacterium]